MLERTKEKWPPNYSKHADWRLMMLIAIRGGPFSEAERAALLDYCESDVDALARLLPAMLPGIDLPRALLRGRYMAGRRRPDRHDGLALLRENWAGIQDRLISEIDVGYGVFDGRTFKADRWAEWLARNGIAWPRHESGRLALDDDTFREMARSHRAVAPIRELRQELSDLRLGDGSEKDQDHALISVVLKRTEIGDGGCSFQFGRTVRLLVLFR